MRARLRKFLSDLSEIFWLLPAVLVLCGIALAFIMLRLDKSNSLPRWLLEEWLYDGGGTGARTLLGAVASSTIGVAGTVFSITIAALSLASGQMGPRLLRNFTRDRGNQITLGVFLGTFSYALIVLRTVRTQDEGIFVPHLALSVSVVLALICVTTLVYFVGHMAGRINVDTVIALVSEEVQSAVLRLTKDRPQADRKSDVDWANENTTTIVDNRRGYLQHLDADELADWAAQRKTAIQLLVRPGDYVFPGAAIAVMLPPVAGADEAIQNATALGAQRVSSEDLEFAVRQLVEVAVRALSPGINDPNTAISVIDRLGSSLCEIAPRRFTTGIYSRDDRVVLIVPSVQYGGLLDAMFHMIRQNAAGKAAVLIRMLDILSAVAGVERDQERAKHLRRHADLIVRDAEASIAALSDLNDIRDRRDAFTSSLEHGPLGIFRKRSEAERAPP